MPTKILIVDDEAIVAEHIRAILGQLGYVVAGTACSTDEAFSAVAATAPELVLMDINLGEGQEGITATDTIRTRYDIPVVFVTAYADDATLARARITHPFGYVIKPFQTRELHVAIEIALHNHNIERRLRASEQRFALAMQATNDGLWDWDIATGKVYYSAAYGEMLGYGPDEVMAHVDFWRHHLHPDDREAALRANFDCIESRTDRFEVEFRLQAKHGDWVWILGKGRVVNRDSRGRALRMVGTHTNITVQKQIVAALAEQAETHRALLSTTLDGIIEADEQANILDVNHGYCQMLGYTREELIGKNVAAIEAKEDPNEVVRHTRQMLREGGGHFEGRHRAKDGRLIDFDVSITYIPKRRRFIAFLRDITEKKQAEAALREREALLTGVLQSTADGILVIGDDSKVLAANRRFQELWRVPDALLAAGQDETLLAYVLKQLADAPGFLAEVRRLYGTEEENWANIDFNDGRIFERYTRAVPLSGQRCRLWSFRDITDRKRAEGALQESEEKFATAFHDSPVAMAIREVETSRYLEVNDRCLRMTGYAREEVVGQTPLEVGWMDEADRAENQRIMTGRDGVNERELRLRHKDGHLLVCTYSSHPVRIGGRPCLLSCTMDVTAQKQAEAALRESEEKFAKAFQRAPTLMTLAELETGRFVAVNDTFLAVSGFTREEAIGHSSLELGWITEEQRKQLLASLEGKGTGAHLELDVRPKHGRMLTVLAACEETSIAGQRFLLVNAVDITERKRAGLLLAARADLGEIAQRSDLDQLVQSALDHVEALTGSCMGFLHFIDPDQKNLRLQQWSTNTVRTMCKAEGKGSHYAVDRAGVWVDALRTRAPVIHNDYASLPHRKGLPPGHAPVIREMVVPILRDNLVVALLGVGNKPVDYTAGDVEIAMQLGSTVIDHVLRRQAAELLRDREATLRAAQRVAHVGNWTWHIQTNRLEWSEEMFRIFGLEPAEFSGDVAEVVSRTIHPEDRAAVEAANRSVMEEGKPIPLEYRVIRADGTVRTVWTEAGELQRDETGRPRVLTGIVQDITERKRAETVLREKESLLSTTQQIAHVGSWSVSLDSRQARWSDEAYRIFGVDPGQFIPTTEGFFALVHPDDRPALQEWLRMAVGGQRPGELAFRVVRPDGTLRFVTWRGELLTADNSSPGWLVGSVQDTTERKEVERQLQQKMANLERFHKVAVGRELQMIELKKEINALLRKSGAPLKYHIVE
jgi:PAS domain S-box-containing protein